MQIKCYYCQKAISDIHNLIEHRTHKFHTECYQKYISAELEQRAIKQKIDYRAKEVAETAAMQQLYTETELAEREELYTYLKNLFGNAILSGKVENQVEKYFAKGYSFSGILKTLKYFYDYQGNSLDESNGGIGIVPYIYEEAKEYYRQLWVAQQSNANKRIEDYIPKVKEVTIKQPKREIRNRFPILESEDYDE